MATVASLQVVIGADTSNLKKELDNVQKLIRHKFGGKALGISQNVATAIGAIGAAFGTLGVMAVRSAAQMEQTQKAFTTLLKDAQLAQTYLDELAQFAATTPFSLPGVLDASKRLLAFGFTAEQTIPVMTALGDAAAGLGLGEEGIQRLTLAIGQMQAKGKVSGEEMLQLAEAGIPAWQMLADTLGVTIPEAMKMGEKGMISSAVGIQAVITGINNKFGGMMKDQSATINGMISNIQDSFGQCMTVVGQQIADGINLKATLQTAMDDLSEFTSKVKEMGIGDALRDMIPTEVGMAISGLAALITAVAIPALVKLGITAASTAVAFVGMTGPIGVAVTAIGAAAYYLWEHWEWFKGQWDDLCWALQLAAGRMAWAIKKTIAGLVGTMAWVADKIASLAGGSELSAEMMRRAEDVRLQIDIELANLEAADQMRKWVTTPEKKVVEVVPEFKPADVNNLGLTSNGSPTVGGGVAAQAQSDYDLQRHFSDRLYQEQVESLESLNNLKAEGTIRALDFETYAHEQKMGMEQELYDFMNSNGQTMLSNFSQGLAQAILQGNNLGKTLQNIGKNIVQMFLTWTIQRKAQSALDSILKKKDTKESQTMAAKEAKAWVDAAVQKSIAELGPIKGPVAYGVAVTSMKETGLASIAVSKANGGYITGPGSGTSDSIPAMLSNGEYVIRASAVDDVGLPFLNAINSGRFTGGGSSVIVTNNNYGDIVTGQDYEGYMEDVNEAVAKGLGGVAF